MHARGVGPSPIPVDQFTLQKLVDAIKFMLDPEVTLQILCLGQMRLFLLFHIAKIDNKNMDTDVHR